MQEMNSAVAEGGVQLLTGVFGLTGGQVSQWASTVPVATSQPLAQGWSQGQTAIVVFPCYTLFGLANQETLVRQDNLLPVEEALEQRWIPGRTEWHQAMPQWWQWSPGALGKPGGTQRATCIGAM